MASKSNRSLDFIRDDIKKIRLALDACLNLFNLTLTDEQKAAHQADIWLIEKEVRKTRASIVNFCPDHRSLNEPARDNVRRQNGRSQ
jgi:hypothetical protein